MNTKRLFSVASAFLALEGLATLIWPTIIWAGTANSISTTLTGIIRWGGGICVAGAVLDWLARDSEAGEVRDALILANTIGLAFTGLSGIVAAIDGIGVFGWILVTMNALLGNAFLIVGLSSLLSPIPPSSPTTDGNAPKKRLD